MKLNEIDDKCLDREQFQNVFGELSEFTFKGVNIIVSFNLPLIINNKLL